MAQRRLERVAAALALCALLAAPALAQITTGNVAGTVKDAQGGVVPGATVVLVSETKGTKSAPSVTNASGDYVFPNVTADTYTVEVTMEGFKTLTRKGVRVSGGDRVAVPNLTIEVGGASETVNVSAEAAIVQSQSGERSFTVDTEQVAEPADRPRELRQPRSELRPAPSAAARRRAPPGWAASARTTS